MEFSKLPVDESVLTELNDLLTDLAQETDDKQPGSMLWATRKS